MELGNIGVIEKVYRPAIPNFKTIDKEILGLDGALYKTSKMEPLDIVVSIRLFNYITRSLDEMIFELMELVYSKEIKPLNYKCKTTWYDAVLVSVDSFEKYRERYAYLELVFRCYNPLARSRYMVEDYKNFTNAKISMNTVCPTKGVFTFTGTSNKITNMRTGEFIEILNGTSQTFTIDCEKNVVNIGSNRAMDRLSPYSEFFEIKNGDIIKANNSVSLKYYERYLFDR